MVYKAESSEHNDNPELATFKKLSGKLWALAIAANATSPNNGPVKKDGYVRKIEGEIWVGEKYYRLDQQWERSPGEIGYDRFFITGNGPVPVGVTITVTSCVVFEGGERVCSYRHTSELKNGDLVKGNQILEALIKDFQNWEKSNSNPIGKAQHFFEKCLGSL